MGDEGTCVDVFVLTRRKCSAHSPPDCGLHLLPGAGFRDHLAAFSVLKAHGDIVCPDLFNWPFDLLQTDTKNGVKSRP
jgi:hypothetical protein